MGKRGKLIKKGVFEAYDLYFSQRKVPHRGWCALQFMICSVALWYTADEHGFKGRYCYPTAIDALLALKQWDGKGDPPGPWIKHKGDSGAYSNPNI